MVSSSNGLEVVVPNVLSRSRFPEGLVSFLVVALSYTNKELASARAQKIGEGPWYVVRCPRNPAKDVWVQLKNGKPAYYYIIWQVPTAEIPYYRPVIVEVSAESGIAGYIVPVIRLKPGLVPDQFRLIQSRIATGALTLYSAFDVLCMSQYRPSNPQHTVLEMLRFSVSNELMERIGKSIEEAADGVQLHCGASVNSNTARIVGDLGHGLLVVRDEEKFSFSSAAYWVDLTLAMELTPDLMGAGVIAKMIRVLNSLLSQAAVARS